MICIPVPVNWVPNARTIDLTGYYDKNVVTDEDGQPFHYPRADLFAQIWGWKHPAYADGSRDDYKNEKDPQLNTIVYQGTTQRYQYKGAGQASFDNWIVNQGHWAQEYQGCAKVRKGLQNWLEPVKYTETAVTAIVV